MQLTPRSYQIECVHSFYSYFQQKQGHPLLALPTGTGKSVILAMILESIFYYYPGQRVLVITHVKELIAQNYEKLLTLWPRAPAGIYSAGLNRKDVGRPITFCGIGSVAKKAKDFGHVDLVLIDEAHLVSTSEETMYRKFLQELMQVNPLMKICGLTATPWRLGLGHLTEGGIFTDVAFDITGLEAFNRLIAEGYLAPLIPKRTAQELDVEGVHKRGGEFIASELQLAVNKHDVTVSALREAVDLADDRKHWLVFASGVDHANDIVDVLNEMGLPAVAVHSKMSDAQRDQAIADFKSGKYRVAVNNNVLTTGFDFPGIDCIIMLRPTASTVLWVQMLGRGTRPAPGKENCLVLDFAGNTLRLGPINDPVLPRKKGEKGGEAPVKTCTVCNTINHASARVCVCCGSEFSFAVKIKPVAGSAELLRNDAPVVDVYKVDQVTYQLHEKADKPPMMKVTYYCNLRSFSEYICFQHDGFAQRKARLWWGERAQSPFPPSTMDGIALAQTLRCPSHLRVWSNKKYPEIMAYCWDGTAFGAQEPQAVSVEVDVVAPRVPWSEPQTQPSAPVDYADIADDDIPF